eukprot:615308-Rhodomonas_salina.2
MRHGTTPAPPPLPAYACATGCSVCTYACAVGCLLCAYACCTPFPLLNAIVRCTTLCPALSQRPPRCIADRP